MSNAKLGFIFLAITVCTTVKQALANQQIAKGRLYRIRFAIQTSRFARIRFSSSTSSAQPYVEVQLESSTRSRIEVIGPVRHLVLTPFAGSLSAHEYRAFIFEWDANGTLFQVYKEDDITTGTPILSLNNALQPFPVTHLGIWTLSKGNWTCDGTNTFQTSGTPVYRYMALYPPPLTGVKVKPPPSFPGCSVPELQLPPKGPYVPPCSGGGDTVGPNNVIGGCSWVKADRGHVPEGGVVGGNEHDEVIFVARALHLGHLIPGKLRPSHGVVYVGYHGKEYVYKEYEVLVADDDSVKWVDMRVGGSLPPNSIPGGTMSNNETLYIGRTSFQSLRSGVYGFPPLTPGKVDPISEILFVPYHGMELDAYEYDILVKV